MIIDFHSHLQNQAVKRAGAGAPPPLMVDIPSLLENQEAAGISASVITHSLFGITESLSGLELLDTIKSVNGFNAELGQKYPERLFPFATAIPLADGGFLKETERAIRQYGMRGIGVPSSVRGEYLDSERAYPFYEMVCELGVPIFVHPPMVPVGADKMDKYRLMETLGRPFDTTLTISRMVFSGVFEKFPKLKAVFAHLGGCITLLPGRLERSYQLRDLPHYGPWGGDALAKAPSEYLKQIYVDSMCFWPPALRCAIDLVGADHVLLGSDTPPLEWPLTNSVRMIEDLEISQEEKAQILGGNAQVLLGLA